MGWRSGSDVPTGSRVRAALLTGAIAAVPLYLSVGPAQSAETASKFTPAADAFVNKSRPKANFGTRSAIKTDSSPVMRSYLRFKVADLPGAVTRATLRILPKSSNRAGVTVHPVSGPWAEKTITWSTAPALGTAAGSSGSLTAESWASIDVTSLVVGNGEVNLALVGPAGNAVAFPSREASSRRPRLVVETDGSTTTTTLPPPPPTTPDPPSSTELPTGCDARLTARQATANVFGYLYGDGHMGSNGYVYTAGTSCRLTRMKNNLQAIGVPYTLSRNKFIIARVHPFDKEQDNGPSPWLDTASADEIKSFIAGVLEGEGSGSGKVFDDPSWNRTVGLVDVYRRIGVVVKPDHQPPPAASYWNTYVDPSATTAAYNGYIEIIRSSPFAEWKRVPNYR